MKRVFTNSSQVYHLWANQSQYDARQGGRITRAFFRGKSAYSYGSHYEVGRIVEYNGVKLGMVNNSGYSHTTSKHISEAYSALDGLMLRIKASTFDVLKALLENQGQLVDMLMADFKALKFWNGYKFGDKDCYALKQVAEFNDLCYKLKHPELALNVTQQFIDLVNDHVKLRLKRQEELQSPEAEAKREASRLRKAELEVKKNADSVKAWKLGGIATQYIRSLRPMLIRINGQTVETSAGAEVPLSEAKMLLKAIQAGTASEGTKVGSFTLNYVQGNIVKIGCHIFDLDDAKAVLLVHKLKIVA